MNTTTRTERFYFSHAYDLAPIPADKVPADVLAALDAFFDTTQPIVSWVTNDTETLYAWSPVGCTTGQVVRFKHSHVAGLTNCLYFGENSVKIMVAGGRMNTLDTAW